MRTKSAPRHPMLRVDLVRRWPYAMNFRRSRFAGASCRPGARDRSARRAREQRAGSAARGRGGRCRSTGEGNGWPWGCAGRLSRDEHHLTRSPCQRSLAEAVVRFPGVLLKVAGARLPLVGGPARRPLTARSDPQRDPRSGTACAGNTAEYRDAHPRRRDHPRVRGEHDVEAIISTSVAGSSPRARGFGIDPIKWTREC